ncbi:MAG: dipeptide epimerase [Thermoguttaceae bacterium]
MAVSNEKIYTGAMRIVQITARIVHVPLRREVKHASATRRASSNLLVCCRLADGSEGWGEGVPREYVTGETPAGAMAQLAATPLAEQLAGDPGTWPEVLALCERFRPAAMGPDPRGCYGNALRCALELSILDAYGRLFREPLSAVTKHFPPARPVWAEQDRVRYSTAITAQSPAAERLNALKMRLYGFAQCKVKVGLLGVDDGPRLRVLRRWIGRTIDLRLDANEAWHAAEVLGKIQPLLAAGISCIEQPVPHAEVEVLADLRRQIQVPLMLDESLTSLADAETAIRLGTCDLFNIRLSKCGGFLASLRLAALAHQAGLGYQLGCHPGETGILSAAGRHWAASVAAVRYLEGSYDRHLLAELLTQQDVTFGYGGWAPALPGPGLGVTIDPVVLQEWTERQETYPLG